LSLSSDRYSPLLLRPGWFSFGPFGSFFACSTGSVRLGLTRSSVIACTPSWLAPAAAAVAPAAITAAPEMFNGTTVETPEEVAEVLRRALDHVDADKLIPSTNCGMAPLARDAALDKLSALSAGAAIVRAELASVAVQSAR
jgi:hypothetical protein